jgi:hypothetical protein
MTNNDLDLRAYSMLLEDIRVRIGKAWTAPEFDVHSTPTHRLDELLTLQIKVLDSLQLQLNYAALKIKHLKEDIGTLPGGLPR